MPSGLIATPYGKLNCALSPAPSTKPLEPVPAKVLTTCVAIMILRMTWL